MIIPCSTIAEKILKDTKKRISSSGIKPHLVVFLIGDNKESRLFVESKKQASRKIGAKCTVIHYQTTPRFISFVKKIQEVSQDKNTHGIIIQLPLPSSLSTQTYANYITPEKDIEAIHPKSKLLPPVGLSVLTILKYLYLPKRNSSHVWNTESDIKLLHAALRDKKIVIIGRGQTGGKPISETLTKLHIGYLMIHSKTPHPENFLQEADIIISAVGKQVITPEQLKKNCTLISVGLRKENGKWLSDYDEKKVRGIAGAYTTTPNGVGKLTVSYLFYNLAKILDK